MEFKHIIHSKKFKIMLIILAELVFAFVMFGAGLAVGFHKARFTGGWYEGYRRNLMGPNDRGGDKRHGGRGARGGRMMPSGIGEDFMGGHGVVGSVISVNPPLPSNDLTGSAPSLTIQSVDGVEKTVFLNSKTTIRKFRDEITAQDIRAGDSVTIIGTPNDDGAITATLVRVMDGLGGPSTVSATSTPEKK